jgi:hypothetical protein
MAGIYGAGSRLPGDVMSGSNKVIERFCYNALFMSPMLTLRVASACSTKM